MQKREMDKVMAIARAIEPRIQREAKWSNSVARLVQDSLSGGMQFNGEERFASISRTLSSAFQKAGVSVLEVTDKKGVVLFRAHEPGRHGDLSSNWGVEEALSGIGELVSQREDKGTLVLSIEPIRSGNKVIGTVSAGTRIDEKFIDELGHEMGVELVLVSHSGKISTSSKHLKSVPETAAITEAFQNKIPVFRTNEKTHTANVYIPLMIVDEAWVIMAELDSSGAYTLLEESNRASLLVTFLVVLGSILVTFAILGFSLKPLHELRLRAEKIVLEIKGKTDTKTSGDDMDSLVNLLNTLTDALMERNRELTKQRADLRISAAAFESQEAMMITDAELVIMRVNKAFTQITGYTSDEVVGQKPRISSFKRHDSEFNRDKWEVIRRDGGWQGEVWDQRKNGEAYPKWLTISAIKSDDGTVTHYIFTHIDITEHKKSEEKIKELAFFDHLTQLPNRNLLKDRLNQAMTIGSSNGTYGALLFIDLDNFKMLNDTMGHENGDVLLLQAAQLITSCVRNEDTVARIGGDEFVVLLGNLNANPKEAARMAETVGGEILAALDHTSQFNEIDHRSSASIGTTLFFGHQTSISDVLKQADLAMYKAKESGRNALCFFDPAMQTIVMEHSALENDLRGAITAKQFILHYQPQVSSDGRVTGAEALVRWQHSDRGMVSPAAFIPMAEQTGLILPLGRWVLETVCVKLSEWASQPDLANLTVAVNVSARQFCHQDFVEQVLVILENTGADPRKLKLELTESMLVENKDNVIQKMLALKARGIGFSLDDFGTGYSSLSYLKLLPLEELKIDQSFVRDVLIDPNDASIAKTIMALAQSLGLVAVAEGVETKGQKDFLSMSGCHSYQGYFFSRPLSVDLFEEFVRRV